MIVDGAKPDSLEAITLLLLHKNGAALDMRVKSRRDDNEWKPRDGGFIGGDFHEECEYRLSEKKHAS